MGMLAERFRLPIQKRRWSLISAYALSTAAGVVAFVTGWSGAIEDALGWMALLWALFMALGGTSATAGQAVSRDRPVRRWWGELFGLPAMYSSFWLLGTVLVGLSEGRGSRIAWGLLLWSFGFLLYARWQTVRRFARDDARLQGEG